MVIAAMNIDKIYMEKHKSIVGNVRIKNSPKIEEVRTTKIVGGLEGDIKRDALEVKFSYTSIYENDEGEIAKIQITGSLIYTHDNNKEIKEIEKEWKKNKKFKNKDIEITIINYLLTKMTIMAIKVADMANLPPVITMPRVVKERNQR